ncbi:hypothetical protein BDN72DRAFT_494082 [Pluteus cervinus]|uniref:Uncharacterized protein n=1 Tax=Pluteus cervinus TaxID=181527 RepID=A0ACD3B0F5_9AGAR|nr:hypothetical protein BDN72DRAFT_494082 [Pluteus cervinus]
MHISDRFSFSPRYELVCKAVAKQATSPGRPVKPVLAPCLIIQVSVHIPPNNDALLPWLCLMSSTIILATLLVLSPCISKDRRQHIFELLMTLVHLQSRTLFDFELRHVHVVSQDAQVVFQGVSCWPSRPCRFEVPLQDYT